MTNRCILLSPHELAAGLTALPKWSSDREEIGRVVEARSFLAAVDLVSRIAPIAEQMNHHPDIDIRWRRLTFLLTTHDAGGVTALDLEFARRIEMLVNELGTEA